MGGQGDILIIASEVEEGALEEPPMSLLALTIDDFKGKEIDPIVEKIARKFLVDEFFVKSRTFIQFFSRNNIELFEAKCKKVKIEQPTRQDSGIEEEVKVNMMQEFNQITLSGGRRLLKDLGVMILLERDTVDVMIFDVVRKEKEKKGLEQGKR